MSTLYITSTPIGNLRDITERALHTLKGVDLILCEDTRITRKLLEHYKIKTSTLSYHQHSKLKKVNYILGLLKQGKDIALVSDAGTPGIADPGNKLVGQIVESLNNLQSQEIKIIPIPGPSAITAAASITGFNMDKFVFMGFPPVKKKRKKFFEEITQSKYPVIFFESPYRILKSLNDLRESEAKLKTKPLRNIMVCRELTKKFETIYRGKIDQVITQLEKDKIKGEFIVIVDARK